LESGLPEGTEIGETTKIELLLDSETHSLDIIGSVLPKLV